MIKAAFIGCGGIAKAHVPGWQEVAAAGDGQVVALCDVSQAGVDALAEALGLTDVAKYTDWEVMLAEQSLDCVDICLPHHLHAPAILAAAAPRRERPVREAAVHEPRRGGGDQRGGGSVGHHPDVRP